MPARALYPLLLLWVALLHVNFFFQLDPAVYQKSSGANLYLDSLAEELFEFLQSAFDTLRALQHVGEEIAFRVSEIPPGYVLCSMWPP